MFNFMSLKNLPCLATACLALIRLSYTKLMFSLKGMLFPGKSVSFASIASHLTRLLKKDVPFIWHDAQRQA